MKPAYWIIQLLIRGKVYVYHEDMPECLMPGGIFPKGKLLIWLQDHSGGAIGFPATEIRSIEWVDDTIRRKDKEFSLAVDGPPEDDREPWQR